ncbi:DUF7577 domain-containing protein [Natronobacterium gregoryi]|uniref:DUF7577 domain-containing protein n=2 Tax=Natronobacterium gregoryi TaxID=44930 RepID=L0AJ58_NATGS|nr:hypothetical protein [Natronobacterium gregoryi]AFZ73192.1 hypothetical protein Natgr_2009 [Natronobacterium gregoryi SP2]ELY71350.1 hypothetical protein C490_05447 [Natronobacterium gregoryi SP2]PLK21602.1 hypothetical protein CYV19_03300 [Natronobacterium gregoryi SP2]SFI58895.1 hypothetical protein SAMN05443661_10272 [Natronobacterium gregoryi]
MELWGWLVGYLLLFVLLHLILYYVYLHRDNGDRTGSPSFADPNRAGSPSSPGPDRYSSPHDREDREEPDEREFDGETIRCPHCGARNAADQTFTYCWHCISTLRR